MAKTKPSKTFEYAQIVEVRGVGRINWTEYSYLRPEGVRHLVHMPGTGGPTRSVPDGRIRASREAEGSK